MILRDRARRGVNRDLKLGAKDICSLLEYKSDFHWQKRQYLQVWRPSFQDQLGNNA